MIYYRRHFETIFAMAQMNRSLVSLFPLQNTTYSPLPCMIVEEHTKCLRKCANDAFPILIDRVLKMKETLFCLYSGSHLGDLDSLLRYFTKLNKLCIP